VPTRTGARRRRRRPRRDRSSRRSSRHLRCFEELQYRAGVGRSHACMLDERDPMRTERFAHLRKVREDRGDDLEVAEHRRCEQVETGTVLEQVEGDLAPPHVRSGAETGLPVAATPVPGGVHERRLLFEERAYDVEVAVGARDEGLDLRRIELWRRVAHARALSAAALPARRPKTTHSSSELPIMRFLPWVPPAISPQAKTPSSVVSACSSITSPPFW